MKISINDITPLSSADYISHNNFIKNLTESVNYINNAFPLIICIGDSGIGKTNLTKQLLLELGYDITEITRFTYQEKNNYKDSHNYKTEIINFISNKTIDMFFKKTKKILLIDDLEIYLQNDKEFQSMMRSMCDISINPLKIPIVCILNKMYSQKLTKDTKKYSHILYFGKPNYTLILNYLLQIIKSFNIILNDHIISNIQNSIKIYKCNIKLILLNIDTILSNNVINNNIDMDMGINSGNIFSEMTTFESVEFIYHNYINITNLSDINISDHNIISLILHENCINQLIKYSGINSKNINKSNKDLCRRNLIINYKKILKDYCLSDKIENHIYSSNSWTNLSMLLIIRLCRLNKIIYNYYSKSQIINKQEYVKYNFSQLLALSGNKTKYLKKQMSFFEKNNISTNKDSTDLLVNSILQIINNIPFNDKSSSLNLLEKEQIKYMSNYIIKKYNIDKEMIDVIGRYNRDFCIIPVKKLDKFIKFIKI